MESNWKQKKKANSKEQPFQYHFWNNNKKTPTLASRVAAAAARATEILTGGTR